VANLRTSVLKEYLRSTPSLLLSPLPPFLPHAGFPRK
jgi:hypothetical protein